APPGGGSPGQPLDQVAGGGAAQRVSQAAGDPFGQEQPAGRLQVGPHPVGGDLQPLQQLPGPGGGPADQPDRLEQGLPFGVPGAGGPLLLLGHGGEQGGHQRRDPGGGGGDGHGG